jgi:hypothetical protein
MKVPSPSLAINKVSFTIQNESHGAKNKAFKTQETKTYLTKKIKI